MPAGGRIGRRKPAPFDPFQAPEPAQPVEGQVELAAHEESESPVTVATEEKPSVEENENEIFDFDFTPAVGKGRKPNPNRYVEVIRNMALEAKKGVVVRDEEDADRQRILLRRAGKENQCSILTSLVTQGDKLILGFQKVARIERKRLSDEEKAQRKAAKQANATSVAPVPSESAADLARNGFAS